MSAPISRAIFATTGAEPVPVPPPIPAVTNTIFAPLRILLIASLSSSAAFSPIRGSPPAPSPCVIFCPMARRLFAFDLFRACKSVFNAMKSTFFISASIIRLTALEPPPPQPTTLIIVGLTAFKSDPSLFKTSKFISFLPAPHLRTMISKIVLQYFRLSPLFQKKDVFCFFSNRDA